jgi:hypothetical protein
MKRPTVASATFTPTGIDPTTGDPLIEVQVPTSGSKEFIRLNVTNP